MTSVLQLTAVLVLAKAAVRFVAYLISGFVIEPIVTPAPHPSSGFSTYPGGFVLAGRIFDWADPATHSLVLVVLGVLAYLVARWQRTPRIACPHCLAQVLPAAAACFNCTRDLPVRADLTPRMKTDAV